MVPLISAYIYFLHVHVDCAWSFVCFFNIEFDRLIFSQLFEFRLNQARFVEKELPAVRVIDKTESAVANQLLYFSIVQVRLPLFKKQARHVWRDGPVPRFVIVSLRSRLAHPSDLFRYQTRLLVHR